MQTDMVSPLEKDNDLLEKVQRRAAQLIYSLHDLPYHVRLKRLKLTTLETRRLCGNLIEAFNPLDARSRYTGKTVYQRNRQNTVYRMHGYQHNRLESGIPDARSRTPRAGGRYTGLVF